MSVKELKDFRSIKVAELILCQEAAEIVNSSIKNTPIVVLTENSMA